MVITVDTSVLLSVLLNEKHKEKIVELTKGDELQAPSSLDAEIGNALSAMFKRNRLTLDEARQVIEQYEQIPVRRTKLRLWKAAELAHTYNIYGYDAYVLDCARQYRTSLISLDKELVTIGNKLGLNMIEVAQ